MKINLSIFAISVFLCLCIKGINAQNLDLAGFNITHFPAQQVKKNTLDDREIGFNEYNVFFNLPKRIKDGKVILLNGINYTVLKPDITNNLSEVSEDNLHTVTLKLGLIKSLNNDWKMAVTLLPTISGSLNNSLESDDFIFQGGISFLKKKSEILNLGFGIVFTSRFGNPIPLPNFQLTRKTENSLFQISLPSHIRYALLKGNLEAGIRLGVGGSRFNTNFETKNVLDDRVIDQINYTRLTLGPQIKYRINKMMVIDFSGGVVVSRNYNLIDNQENEIDYSLENGPFIKVGLSISPKLRSK